MKKKKSWIEKNFNLWILNEKWTKGFMISHISGWTMACLQTIWIVWEIRYFAKKILKAVNKS